MYATINISVGAVRGTQWERERPLTPEVFATIQTEARQPGGRLSPGFATTVTGKEFGGCFHELILAVRPDLAPLVRLHLSDLDGAPMHALANGEHWFSGILDAEVGAGYPYRPTSGRDARTPDECREIACQHFRVDAEEMNRLVDGARQAISEPLKLHERRTIPMSAVTAALYDYLSGKVDAMRPRWKAEAEAGLALLRTLV